MLPRSNRLTTGDDFSRTVRTGRRSGSRTLVAHWLPADLSDGAQACVKVGFVVSGAVGSAVTRNRVRRRLRHLVAQRLDALPAGRLVVRALAPAAHATSAELAVDLDGCLRRTRALEAA